MLTLTSTEITAWVGAYLWPLFRIGAALGSVPVIGTMMVPVRIRLALAIALTIVIAPLAPRGPVIDPLSLAGVLVTFQQIVIGVAMGLALHFVFNAFVFAGEIIAMQMGLGFASMVDPQNGVSVPVVSQFYVILVTLVFLALDGHLALIELLADSFHTIPIGPAGLALPPMWDLVLRAGQVFAGALAVALPAVAALLVVNIAFGVMTRAAPQLNVFALGFPLTLLLGFVLILFTLPATLPQITQQLEDGFDFARLLLGGTP